MRFVTINTTCRTDSGFTAVSDVNQTHGGSAYDNQESFLFAEVLKYSYLAHSGVQKGDKNTFVFNTEGHPVRVVRG
ncbi:unnamed protein product [Penicillium pancosmium]